MPVDSDTFRVASLQSRSTKPGMLRRAAAEEQKEGIFKTETSSKSPHQPLTCMTGMISNLTAASQPQSPFKMKGQTMVK